MGVKKRKPQEDNDEENTTWVCDCGKINEDYSNICQECCKIKPGADASKSVS